MSVARAHRLSLSSLSSFLYTNSDGAMDDNATANVNVIETLVAHKQIISTIKTQTWPMFRKLKVLRRAKLFIKKHEGELKQSKQAKDIFSSYKAYMEKTIGKLNRRIANLVVQLTPWEMRIKKIESQFGSVVASYFIFLRWVFWINTGIAIYICVFLMLPEVLKGVDDPTGMRKEVKDQESALTLQSIWDFEGYLKFSPLFYGYYSNVETDDLGYRLPLSYFLSCLLLYLLSFFCILRKMAQTARMSKAGSQDDEFVFCWKLFTGWDFMIGNSETAYNKVASIVMGLKEVILEENERKKEEATDWKMTALRIIANIVVLFLLGTSAYAVVLVVERSQNMPENPGWVRENEVTLVLTGIGNLYPNLFNIIGMVERYHPGIQLQWQLARILVLNLLNLYTLMFSQFGKVDKMTAELKQLKYNITVEKSFRMTTETEVTVTVLTERAERAERSVDEELEAIEGRYYWLEPATQRKPETVTTTSSNLGNTVIINGTSTANFISSSTTARTTSTSTAETKSYDRNRPLIIREEYGEYDDDLDLIEGRHRVPASRAPRPPTASGTSIDPGGRTESTTDSYRTTRGRTRGTGRWTEATTDWSTTKSKATKGSGTTFKPSSASEEEMPVEVSTSTSFDAELSTTFRSDMEMTTTWEMGCQSEEDRLSAIDITDDDLMLLSDDEKANLRNLCWETMFGQELTKLTVMDLVVTVVSTIIGDFLRAVIVRYCNGKACFFWDLEKGWPGYSDFAIAENILHLVNNQGMVWLGMFYSPGLPGINTLKLCIMMYVRSWAVLTCNIPHETVFKASGNNFYYALLLLMLFICCLPVCYSCVWLEPSWHCGPFSGYRRVYHIFTKYIESLLPEKINKVVDYLTSPGTIVPLLSLLMMTIYWLYATNANLKEANNDLKMQLRKDKDLIQDELAASARPEISTVPGAEKKHVRINEEVEVDTNSLSDKKPELPV